MDVQLGQDQAAVEQLLNEMAKNPSNALIVFQKNAILGKVKTRLAGTVGDQKALEIYAFLTKKTFEHINQTPEIEVFVYFSDTLEEKSAAESSISYKHCLQTGFDLGERMKHAFREVFQLNYTKVAIIGTDCPNINRDILEDAFNTLDNSDVVIGPAKDGGYYLLGMSRFMENVFDNIPWSTSAVLQTTTKRLIENNVPFQYLTFLSDIDTEEDWLDFIKTIPSEK